MLRVETGGRMSHDTMADAFKRRDAQSEHQRLVGSGRGKRPGERRSIPGKEVASGCN